MLFSLNKLNRAIQELDPDRIYVENMRYMLGTTTRIAKFICELAVRKGYFQKHYAIECGNEGCRRIIKSFDSSEEIPEKLSCFVCEDDGEDESDFFTKELNVIVYYSLVKESYRIA